MKGLRPDQVASDSNQADRVQNSHDYYAKDECTEIRNSNIDLRKEINEVIDEQNSTRPVMATLVPMLRDF